MPDSDAIHTAGEIVELDPDAAASRAYYACFYGFRTLALRGVDGGIMETCGTVRNMKSEILDEAKRLSVNERIELVEEIWNLIAEDAAANELPLSDAHREELDRRLQDWRANPETTSSWEEVRERMKRKE